MIKYLTRTVRSVCPGGRRRSADVPAEQRLVPGCGSVAGRLRQGGPTEHQELHQDEPLQQLPEEQPGHPPLPQHRQHLHQRRPHRQHLHQRHRVVLRQHRRPAPAPLRSARCPVSLLPRVAIETVTVMLEKGPDSFWEK